MFTPEQRRLYVRAAGAKFRAKHPKAYADKYRLKKYGLSQEGYEARLLEQENLCKICRKPEPGVRNGIKKALAVDHNHATGEIRGLLCSKCNTAIGLFCEDVSLLHKAAQYLLNFL